MKAEAEANAEADRKEGERIAKINQADSMIFQTENMLQENGDKIPADVKAEIEGALGKLKDAHKAQDIAAIDAAINELNSVVGKMYQGAQGQPGAQPGGAGFDQGHQQPNGGKNDDIQDADFEEVH